MVADSHYAEILSGKYTNKQTLNAYLNRIKTLKAKLDVAELHTILVDPDTYYPRLQKLYPSLSTRKNLLTPILALYREDDALARENVRAYERWKKLHDDLSRLQAAKVRRSEPEAKQVEKYTSFEDIEAKYEELKKRGFHDTERHSLQYLLVSIFVHLRPKRADLGSIKIYKDDDPRKIDENYVVLRKKGTSFLVMNLYKTSKYYQTVEEDLPEGLVKDLRVSLSRWPRDHLFRKDDGKPMSNNTFSVFVKTTFEQLFGRATGVSLLRHIYITEKLNFDDMTLEEQNEEAKLMLHTSGLQRQYKWPKKTICPKLCAAYIEATCKTKKSTSKQKTPEKKRKKTVKAKRETKAVGASKRQDPVA
jgi:hypothetical protein